LSGVLSGAFSKLTSILCTENEQKLKIKDLEGEEKLLSSHKEMARKLRLDKEANEETVRELKGNVSALKKEVDGFDHNLKKLDQLRKELADLNGKTEKLNFEIKNLLSRQEPLEETLRAAGEDPDDFDESSMEDVTEARNKLQAAMENGTEKRDEVEGMIVRASNEVAAIEASLSSARQLESDLRAEMQQFKNRVNEWKKNSLNVSNR
jgi:chromosome segregation ATPase